MKAPPILAGILALITLSLPACQHHEEHAQEQQKIIGTSPEAKDVIVTQRYVCQIHSQRHIEVKAMEEGYLEQIQVKEGQSVKQGEVLFKVIPAVYLAKIDTEWAEVQLCQIKYDQTMNLFRTNVVSQPEVALKLAELNKAQAKYKLAQAEWNFSIIRASFDGIIDRLLKQEGSLVEKDAVLTTLSDNSVMWVYFNVPEARYFEDEERQALEDKARRVKTTNISRLELVDSRIELLLADGSTFEQDPGNVVTVEGQFDNTTGNIKYRADFPNPERLLRQGQTGTVLVHRRVKNAIVIPQRATFEILDKRYVWVIGEDHVAHQRLITIKNELEDVFVIKSGLEAKDKIVLEGVREVHDGAKVEYEFRKPEVALANQKFHAE